MQFSKSLLQIRLFIDCIWVHSVRGGHWKHKSTFFNVLATKSFVHRLPFGLLSQRPLEAHTCSPPSPCYKFVCSSTAQSSTHTEATGSKKKEENKSTSLLQIRLFIDCDLVCSARGHRKHYMQLAKSLLQIRLFIDCIMAYSVRARKHTNTFLLVLTTTRFFHWLQIGLLSQRPPEAHTRNFACPSYKFGWLSTALRFTQ